MSKLRGYAPVFIKRIIWNWKHRRTSIDQAECPNELLESLGTLPSTSGVLDLGCGAGNLRAALRSRGWHGHFVGVDVSGEAIEAAKKSGDSNAEWHVSAIEYFPIPNQKVDTICLCESIYYVEPGSVANLIARCRKSLASGGRIVMRIHHADRHSKHIEIVAGLGAECKPPIYVLTNNDGSIRYSARASVSVD